MNAELVMAVAVTAELCGRTFSPEAARIFVTDLSAYPEQAVLRALTRCRKEIRGILTISDVVSRIEDGRPGVEEAWSMLPRSENDSAVWTEEMREAYRVAAPLLDEGDKIAARMAFKEAYQSLVQSARDSGVPASWSATLGHDKTSREVAIKAAVERGRLTPEHAQTLLPAPTSYHPAIVGLLTGPDRVSGPPEHIRSKLMELKKQIKSRSRQ